MNTKPEKSKSCSASSKSGRRKTFIKRATRLEIRTNAVLLGRSALRVVHRVGLIQQTTVAKENQTRKGGSQHRVMRLECCAHPTAVSLMRPKGIRKALSFKVIKIRLGASGFLAQRAGHLKNMKGRVPRNANIDLGLAILASISEPPHTATTIAAYCGCSRQAIQQIEHKALRKLRASLYRDRVLTEALEHELQGLSKK